MDIARSQLSKRAHVLGHEPRERLRLRPRIESAARVVVHEHLARSAAPSQSITDLQSVTAIGGRQLLIGRQYSRSRGRSALPEPLNGKSPLPDPRGTAAAPHACPP